MSHFVQLYSALWNRMFGLDQYAKIKSQAGQQPLFGNEPQPAGTPDPGSLGAPYGKTPFGKGKGELLFTEEKSSLRPDASGHIVTDGRRMHITNYAKGARDAYQDTLAMRGPDHRITKLARASMEEAEKLLEQHRAASPEPTPQSRQMIAKPTTSPATAGRKLPPHHVIADVRDQAGTLLAQEFEPHDGTPDGIRRANSTLRARLDDLHPSWSNVMTRTGATNEHGHPAWVVSPNSANVYETGTPEARSLIGTDQAATGPAKPGIAGPNVV